MFRSCETPCVWKVGDEVAGRFADMMKAHVRKRTASYVFVIVVFAAGVLTGAFALDFVSDDGRSALVGEIRSMMRPGETRPVAPEHVLRTAAAEYVLQVPLFIGLLGLSVIGAPLILAVIFVRGFVLGFTTMFLIDGLVVPGFFLAVAALLPQNLLAVPAVVAAGAGALAFSGAAARVLVGRRDINMYHHFVTTAGALVFSAAALVGAALIEAYISPVLMNAAARFFM